MTKPTVKQILNAIDKSRKTAEDKLPLDLKKKIEYWKWYEYNISTIHDKILNLLKDKDIPQEYIDEIEFLMWYEHGKLYEDAVFPYNNAIVNEPLIIE